MRYITILILIIFSSCKGQQSTDNKQKAFQILSHKNVKIYESEKNNGLGPCEPSIYINPKNPTNIVAGSIIDKFHFSMDGGATWSTDILISELGVYGDPCVIADNLGNFYYLHLSDPEGTNWSSDKMLDQIVIQKSVDGGKTWNSGSGIGKNPPKQQDKEWAIANYINNDLYVTWTEFDKYGSYDKKHKSRILFSKSTDESETWTKPTVINQYEGDAIDDDKTTEGAVPSVGINGEIYVSWSYDNTIYFDRSLDNGTTWLQNDIEVADQPEGWNFDIPGVGRSNGMPITCTDISNSSYRGTIYVNWADQRNGKKNTDVFLAKSTDGGTSWSDPIKVNQDTSKTHQFFTWMSVDPKTGFIYIIYYDRSKYTDNQTDVVLSYSKDGGISFSSKTISESPFIPIDDVFFGDYNNISAFDGIVRPVWTRYENNKLSIWTALINMND